MYTTITVRTHNWSESVSVVGWHIPSMRKWHSKENGYFYMCNIVCVSLDASWEVAPQNNLFGGILSVLFSVSLSLSLTLFVGIMVKWSSRCSPCAKKKDFCENYKKSLSESCQWLLTCWHDGTAIALLLGINTTFWILLKMVGILVGNYNGRLDWKTGIII